MNYGTLFKFFINTKWKKYFFVIHAGWLLGGGGSRVPVLKQILQSSGFIIIVIIIIIIWQYGETLLLFDNMLNKHKHCSQDDYYLTIFWDIIIIWNNVLNKHCSKDDNYLTIRRDIIIIWNDVLNKHCSQKDYYLTICQDIIIIWQYAERLLWFGNSPRLYYYLTISQEKMLFRSNEHQVDVIINWHYKLRKNCCADPMSTELMLLLIDNRLRKNCCVDPTSTKPMLLLIDNKPRKKCCVDPTSTEPILLFIDNKPRQDEDYYYAQRLQVNFDLLWLKEEKTTVGSSYYTSFYSIARTLSNSIYNTIPRFCIDLLWLMRPTGVSSCSSINWANLLWRRAASSGLAATCLGKYPMVQSSVPSRTKTALTTVSIRASGSGSPGTWYRVSCTSLLNLTIWPGTTWQPQHSCWLQEWPLSGLFSPTILPSCCCSWVKCSLNDNQQGDCQEAAEGQWAKDTVVEVKGCEMLVTGNSCRSLAIVVMFFEPQTVSSTATASDMANTEKRTLRRNERLWVLTSEFMKKCATRRRGEGGSRTKGSRTTYGFYVAT